MVVAFRAVVRDRLLQRQCRVKHDLVRTRVSLLALGAPPPAKQGQGGGLFSGLASTVLQGAAFGTGSAVAHRAIDAAVGGREGAPMVENPQAASQMESSPCQRQTKAFADCMTENNGDMGLCQFYFDMLQQCKLNH